MFYSCTHIATVGFKGLETSNVDNWDSRSSPCHLAYGSVYRWRGG